MNGQPESRRAKLALEVSSMGHSSTSCARASAFAHATRCGGAMAC